MDLLKHSFILAVRATPHLIVSKFFFEFRLGFYGVFATMAAVLAAFTAPVMIVFVPLTIAFTNTANTLTNMHSLLGFIGVARRQTLDYLVSEVIKISMMRGLASLLVSLLVALMLIALYGTAHFAGTFSAPLETLLRDISLLNEGRIPALIAASLLYTPFSLILGALFAVPTAGAAYAIGPSDRVFNGFWGIGFNFWPILASRLAYMGLLGGFALLVVIFFIPEISLRSLVHIAQSALAGTKPDLLSYPISEPKFETMSSQIALLFWIVFMAISYSPSGSPRRHFPSVSPWQKRLPAKRPPTSVQTRSAPKQRPSAPRRSICAKPACPPAGRPRNKRKAYRWKTSPSDVRSLPIP